MLDTADIHSQQSVSDQARFPPRSRSSHTKRRLATTRGFNNNYSPSRGSSYIITPNNSPSVAFRPIIKSTPSGGINQNSVHLPDHPPLSPGVIQLNPLVQPTVKQPLSSIQFPVISPRPSIQEASLDWDNYGDIQFHEPLNSQVENNFFGSTYSLSGIEEVRKITLVDTSESSLSTENMSMRIEDKINLGANANEQIRTLQNMSENVEDMM